MVVLGVTKRSGSSFVIVDFWVAGWKVVPILDTDYLAPKFEESFNRMLVGKFVPNHACMWQQES